MTGIRTFLTTLSRPRFLRLCAGSGLARAVAVAVVVTAALFGADLAPASAAPSRIKDIADVEGIRDNMLIGYGLVVGLKGTGDNIDNMAFTKESLIGMLERLGVNTRGSSLKSKNVAAVMVTANLHAFARQGSRIDVTVSALGDAKSLMGGMLLVTPLIGADGEVYAVSQGTVQVGGFEASGAAATITKGVPTAGRIPGGAIVEREVPFELASMQSVNLALRNPDITTATRIAEAVNAYMGALSARASDPGTVQVAVPPGRSLVDLMTEIEQLRIEPDMQARVVIDETSGTIVIGDNVRVSRVAIAQGNLTIKVTETPQVSQPNPFSTTGETVTVPRTDIQVDEQADRKLAVVDGGVSLQEVVNGLNALGIGPRDMITILQAIKASGALQAEIEVM